MKSQKERKLHVNVNFFFLLEVLGIRYFMLLNGRLWNGPADRFGISGEKGQVPKQKG